MILFYFSPYLSQSFSRSSSLPWCFHLTHSLFLPPFLFISLLLSLPSLSLSLSFCRPDFISILLLAKEYQTDFFQAEIIVPNLPYYRRLWNCKPIRGNTQRMLIEPRKSLGSRVTFECVLRDLNVLSVWPGSISTVTHHISCSRHSVVRL